MRLIDSPERMTEVIRKYGIIPFFSGPVPGWSISEMTDPAYWFGGENEEELGPWDWKIEAIREGDIAYGKFLGGKAAFATVEWYRELMNWRRSLPKYRIALGERYKASTNSEKLMRTLAPAALQAVKAAGALESRELRQVCTQAVSPALLRSLGAKYKPLLTPSVKKGIVDSVVQFLQMGTWTVIGDIQRVYRGPDLHYNGWQRASNTTPDALFRIPAERTQDEEVMRGKGRTLYEGIKLSGGRTQGEEAAAVPAWARRFEEATAAPLPQKRSPEESRERLISHIRELFPATDRKTLLKLI